ncbi:MAG: GNAT family N-acetyltransferase [Alphaproteobacteria bacterium]|nr:GNAT family N-acetyltransferase [Alphaproteobacteria bacterium]
MTAIIVDDEHEWDSISLRLALWPLEQCHAYGQAARSIGQIPLRLRLDVGGERVQAQFLVRRVARFLTLSQSIRGPVATSWQTGVGHAALAALFEGLPRCWPALTLAMPEATARTDTDALLRPLGFRRVISPYRTALLDLRSALDALHRQMWPAWRNRLAAGLKSRLRTEAAAGGPLLDWVMRASLAEMGRRRVRGPSLPFAQSLTSALGPRRVLAVAVRDDQGPCAGAIFLKHGPDATYWLSVTTENGRRISAGNLVLWRAIEILKCTGTRILDLGGIDTDRAPGIARFKLGLGAEPHSLVGTYA